MRLYAIGDVHGHLDLLRAAHHRIDADRARTGDAGAPVVHLGDYCDRGPDTAGVLQALIDGIAAGAPWHCLKGNHDALMAEFLADAATGAALSEASRFWLDGRMGGAETLASYGITRAARSAPSRLQRLAPQRIPESHRAFLEGLTPSFETDALFLAHAGIRPGVPLQTQTEEDLTWIRWHFLDDPRDHGKLIVHGHTPVEAPMHCGNRVALDTGAGYGRPLTAAVFEGPDCFILTDKGRVPLLPG